MIAAEMDSNIAVVRIHDEYYIKEPGKYMMQMNQIVSNAYRRRSVSLAAATNCQPHNVDTIACTPV